MTLSNALQNKKLAFFLDYDGTLTPIASTPDLALLTEEKRNILKELSTKFPVAIISGRDRKDVEALVALPNLYYAGSHGFDIAGPNGFSAEMGQEYLHILTQAQEKLQPLKHIPGILVERKKYAIAIHYRQSNPELVPQIESKVKKVQESLPSLRIRHGKKVFELQPDIPWDKGKALLHLIDLMKLSEETCPVYIGDDVTDEDAFLAIKNRGIGIKVSEGKEETAATYQLKDPEEVFQLFQSLLDSSLIS